MAAMVADRMADRPRCLNRSCPVRFRGGPSRFCPMCAADGDTVATRMATVTEAMATAPGEPAADSDGGENGGPPDDQPTTLAAYLAQRPASP